MILPVELPGKSEGQIVMAIRLKMFFLISAFFCTFGCSLAEIRSQNQAIQAENRQVYQIYQEYLQSQNELRERSGLPPRPIRSYEDWQKSPSTD
jgi:hypothetical protein